MRARVATGLVLLAGLATAGLTAAGPAQADIYQQVQAVYERHGSIPPCLFTSSQLETTLKKVDTYGAQYFADFTNAVQAALASRASGECSPGGPAGHALSAGSADGPLPASPTSPTGAALPGPILLMAGMAALAALGLAGAGLIRLAGWDPPWVSAWRHAFAEAGYRAGNRWVAVAETWRAVTGRRRGRAGRS